MADIAFAETWTRRSYDARRRLLAAGQMSADDVAFMDKFDADALERFKRMQSQNVPITQAGQEER